MYEIYTKLKGVSFDGRQKNLELAKPGELFWEHEPDNQYDANSIHVYIDKEKKLSAGHLSREIAADVVRAIGEKRIVRILCKSVTGGPAPKAKGMNVMVLIGEAPGEL